MPEGLAMPAKPSQLRAMEKGLDDAVAPGARPTYVGAMSTCVPRYGNVLAGSMPGPRAGRREWVGLCGNGNACQ